tara:strand:+ start:1975 stop:2484 length:510 start_codon:yes stop_codon:yes gene_type:complete
VALAYTSFDRITNQVPEIGSITNLSSAQIVEMGEYAEAEIHTLIAENYSVPVAGTVPLLQKMSTDMACYVILTRRIFTSERLKNSEWPDRFTEARSMAMALGDGSMYLVDSAGALIGTRTDIALLQSTTDGYRQTHAAGVHPFNQRVDPNRVRDEANDRDFGFVNRILR